MAALQESAPAISCIETGCRSLSGHVPSTTLGKNRRDYGTDHAPCQEDGKTDGLRHIWGFSEVYQKKARFQRG